MFNHQSLRTLSSWVLFILISGLFILLFSFSQQNKVQSALANINHLVINQIDPVGENFRISNMGPDGDIQYHANQPDLAYNSQNNEFLVVWQGEDDASGLVIGEFEIFGQRINAETGVEMGEDFLISDMGGIGNSQYVAYAPAVAYNSTSNEYLVVWYGQDNNFGLVDGEFEIFGQRIDAATGLEVGTNDFLLSNAGGVGDAAYDAINPDVVFNSVENEYLVVWEADNGVNNQINDEVEIFIQRVDGETGNEIGSDTRISDMGPNENDLFEAEEPTLAYNSINNTYLVTWTGDDDINGLVDDEYEIFGQRLDGATATEIGANDFRISDMGPNGDTAYIIHTSAVAFNPSTNEFFVVWAGEDNTENMQTNEREIFAQRIDAQTGQEIGTNDQRISDMGGVGETIYDAFQPDVHYNPFTADYLVVWRGDDNLTGLADNEDEIFGQEIDGATGVEIGENDIRISDVGPDGNPNFDATIPSLDFNSINHQYLVVWQSDDDVNGMILDELEILGQRLQLPDFDATRTPTPTLDITPPPSLTPTPPPSSPANVYLPLLLRPLPCLPASLETEPNNNAAEADGPLCLNQDYSGQANNGEGNWDYYVFTLPSAGTFTVDITSHPLATVNGAQVLLYYEGVSTNDLVGGPDVLPPYQLTHTGLAGTYYIVLYNDISKCGQVDCDQNYVLRITVP